MPDNSMQLNPQYLPQGYLNPVPSKDITSYQYGGAPPQAAQSPIPQNQGGLLSQLMQSLTGNSPTKLMGQQFGYQKQLQQLAADLDMRKQEGIAKIQKENKQEDDFIKEYPGLAQLKGTPQFAEQVNNILQAKLNQELQSVHAQSQQMQTPEYQAALGKGMQATAAGPDIAGRAMLSQNVGQGGTSYVPASSTTPTTPGVTARGATQSTAFSPTTGLGYPTASPGGTTIPVPPELQNKIKGIQDQGSVNPFQMPQPTNLPTTPVSTPPKGISLSDLFGSMLSPFMPNPATGTYTPNFGPAKSPMIPPGQFQGMNPSTAGANQQQFNPMDILQMLQMAGQQ